MKAPNMVFIDQLYAQMNVWGMDWHDVFQVLGEYFAGRAGNCRDVPLQDCYDEVAGALYSAQVNYVRLLTGSK